MANTSLAVNQPTATGTEPAFFAVKLSMGSAASSWFC